MRDFRFLLPAGQAVVTDPNLPSGLPVGPIVQTGSSITPTFVAVTVGALALITGLSYYLTRAPTPLVRANPSRRRARRRVRRGRA